MNGYTPNYEAECTNEYTSVPLNCILLTFYNGVNILKCVAHD